MRELEVLAGAVAVGKLIPGRHVDLCHRAKLRDVRALVPVDLDFGFRWCGGRVRTGGSVGGLCLRVGERGGDGYGKGEQANGAADA